MEWSGVRDGGEGWGGVGFWGEVVSNRVGSDRIGWDGVLWSDEGLDWILKSWSVGDSLGVVASCEWPCPCQVGYRIATLPHPTPTYPIRPVPSHTNPSQPHPTPVEGSPRGCGGRALSSHRQPRVAALRPPRRPCLHGLALEGGARLICSCESGCVGAHFIRPYLLRRLALLPSEGIRRAGELCMLLRFGGGV